VYTYVYRIGILATGVRGAYFRDILRGPTCAPKPEKEN
jgi:hypothetical protein